nr:OmpH family outer membrane protein [Glaciimonas immobilis]
MAAVLALCLSSVTAVHAQEGSKIAFVSNERIFREAAPAKAADAKIQAEFSKRDKDLQDLAARLKGIADKLDKDSAVIPESERLKRQRELADLDKDFQRKQREFREDLNQRRNEELAIVLERTNKVIKQIADAENYDIVFQDAVYANKRIDITDKVLKALNK